MCHKIFAENKGTPFYRLRTAKDVVVIVVTLLAYGCPVQAIVMAFDLDERTVLNWQGWSGKHCQQGHEHLVEQPRDLGQVQADGIRVKMQGLIAWMAMAIQVRTRLWLGGAISQRRDRHLMRALMQRVRRCALCRPLLFCVDGGWAYIDAIRNVLREPLPGQAGRPRLRAWDGVVIAQVVKQYAQGRVIGVTRKVLSASSPCVFASVVHGLLVYFLVFLKLARVSIYLSGVIIGSRIGMGTTSSNESSIPPQKVQAKNIAFAPSS